jgi:hypothetical protein
METCREMQSLILFFDYNDNNLHREKAGGRFSNWAGQVRAAGFILALPPRKADGKGQGLVSEITIINQGLKFPLPWWAGA